MKGLLLFALIATGTLAVLSLSYLPSLAESGESRLKHGEDLMKEMPSDPAIEYPKAYFGGGCFWCVESEFRELNGVLFTRVGYMGGDVDNVTYEQVTTGETGHAEAVEVTYNPEIISLDSLVRFFLLTAHDPTEVDRQWVDVGTQYRSVFFYSSDEEMQVVQQIINEIDNDKVYSKPIATQLIPMSTFWLGEDYHQQYYEKYREKNGYDHMRVQMHHKGVK